MEDAMLLRRTCTGLGLAFFVAPAQAADWSAVRGSWRGQTSPIAHDISLSLDATGKFEIQAQILGKDSGQARFDGATIVIPLSNHRGQLRLTHKGNVLQGSAMFGTQQGTVSLTRSA